MTAYTLSGAYGAFALTGSSASLACARLLDTTTPPPAWGIFSLTGEASYSSKTCVLVATYRRVSLTGGSTVAGLGFKEKLLCGYFSLLRSSATMPAQWGRTISERPVFGDPTDPSNLISLTQSEEPLVGEAASWKISFGPTVSEALQLNDPALAGMIYSRLIYEGVPVSSAFQLAIVASCSETITFSQTSQLALAVTILQDLFAGDAASTTLKFSLSVAEAMLSSAAFGSFLGVSVAELSGVADALTPLFRFGATISEGTTLGELASGSLLVSVALADGATFDDNNLLQYIFNGAIAEGVDITAGYVAPSGTFTSWAINTRTTGVTEYQDFAFDSLIQSGRKSLGANATGLYELDGDTDAGAPIVADILSGYMQLGGSHFKAFKAAYLGVATPGGQFVLKLITGDGATYAYTVTARTMHTARVNFGKGLRNRYFRFELQNIDGADFNLDNVEFIPLVSQRRV